METKKEDQAINEKKSFVLYNDYINVVEKLIMKDRTDGTNTTGELFYAIMQYVNGEAPDTPNFVLEMAFEPIKQQLNRDFDKWAEIRKKRVEAGRKGGIKSGEVRAIQQNEANEANA
jgi:hypothetical protein